MDSPPPLPPPFPENPGQLGLLLAEPRKLGTPSLEDLESRFASHQSNDRRLLRMEVAVVIVVACLGLWLMIFGGSLPWLQILVTFVVGFCAPFWFLFSMWASPRKPLAELKATIKFGRHDKVSLMASVQAVLDRLNLAGRRVTVYLAPDKDINATALRWNLTPEVPISNGVNLNRSLVHYLDEPELRTVIGHELGHVCLYAPAATSWLLVHGLFCASLSLCFGWYFRDQGLMLAGAVPGVMVTHSLVLMASLGRSRIIEFLCDAAGAKAGGLYAAMRGELKLGMENEVRMTFFTQIIEAQLQGTPLTMDQMLEEFEKTLPFGSASDPAIKEQLQARFREKIKANDHSLTAGMAEWAFGGGSPSKEDLETQLKLIQAQSRLARVPVPLQSILELLDGPEEQAQRAAELLVQAIEENPRCVLFPSSEAESDVHSTHPITSRRILFLWRNKAHFPSY